MAIVEMNIYDVMFGSGLQLLGLGMNDIFDKVNLLSMYVAFFALVFYTLGFYCLIYAQ